MSINFCYTNSNIVALKSVSRKCHLIEKNYSGKEVIIETYNTENRKTQSFLKSARNRGKVELMKPVIQSQQETSNSDMTFSDTSIFFNFRPFHI